MLAGVPGAVMLQQIHFWTTVPSAQERGGHRWVYNSYQKWQAQFPYWSIDQIRRVMARLEELGFLISTSEFNRAGGDQSKWYRIDHDALERALDALRPERTNGVAKTTTGVANPTGGVANSPPYIGTEEHTEENTEENTERTVAAATISEPSKSKSAKPRRRIPDDFTLTTELRAYATSHGDPNPEKTFAQFTEYWRGEGRPKADWPATWRTRVLADEARRGQHSAAPNGMPPEIAALAPNSAKRLLWEEKRRTAAKEQP